MPTVAIDDPELLDTKKVDGSGKIYIGNEWAGMDATFVIVSVEEVEESED